MPAPDRPERKMIDLLRYDPEYETKLQKRIEAAREIYARCTDGKVWQPVLTGLDGILNKFYMYLTFDCPLRCSFCFAEGGERKGGEMAPETLAGIVRQAVSAGFRSIVFTGGEPLVYREIDRLMCLLSGTDRQRSRFDLRTSFGFEIPEARMRTLCCLFDRITVSVDGNEQSHDAVRGRGRYRQTLDNLRRAQAVGGARIGIHAVLTKEQFSSEPGRALIRLTDELGIDDLTVTSPFPMGRGSDTHAQLFKWVKNKDRTPVPEMKFRCGLGNNLYMQPDGKLFPCYAWCEPEHRLGDLSAESLPDVLARGELLKYANTGVDTNVKCRSCEVRYFCGGKCKIFVRDHRDINSGDFDCESTKKHLLDMLRRGGILPAEREE